MLCEKVPSERLFQKGESMNNKYKSFNVDELRDNLIKIINFSSKSPEERASAIVESSVRDEGLRRELLESKKKKLQKKSEKRKAQGDTAKGVPKFHGKIIQHKMFDEEQGKDVWYKGIVTMMMNLM